MRWLKENEPESYQKAKYFLTAIDYIRFKLTGELNAEVSSQFRNRFDQYQGTANRSGNVQRWEVLKKLQI